MSFRRGRGGLLSFACCVILLGILGSFYLVRPRALLDKTHRKFILQNQFCGCSDDVAVYVKRGAACPARLQGKAVSCPWSSSFYQHFIPRTVAAATTGLAASAETADAGVISIVVPGLVQGCSETAASCSTSYSFSWTGGAGASISTTSGNASTTQLPSVTASSSYGGSTYTALTNSAIITSMSMPMSTLPQSTMMSSMKSSMSNSIQSSCQSVSGILSSWSTTGTFIQDYSVVLSTWIAGYNGVETAALCTLGTEVWLPVSITSASPRNASASTSLRASGAGSGIWTTTMTPQQGLQTVVLALKNTVAINGATEILSTISSSTISLPPTTSSSISTASAVPVPSSATSTASSITMTSGYKESSAAGMIAASMDHTPGASWTTTTTTLTQGSVAVAYVDLMRKASNETLVVIQISTSTLGSAVPTGFSTTGSRIIPIHANTSLSSGSTGMSLPQSSIQLTTLTIAAVTSALASLSVNLTIGGSTTGNTSASLSITTSTLSATSHIPEPATNSVSIDMAWTPAGSTFSTQFTYTNTDLSSGEVVLGASSWLAVSMNAHSTRTDFLGAGVVSVIPWTGTPPVGTATQFSFPASTTVGTLPPSVTMTASSITSASFTSVSVILIAGPSNVIPATSAASPLNSTTSPLLVLIESSTRSSTITVTTSSTTSVLSAQTSMVPMAAFGGTSSTASSNQLSSFASTKSVVIKSSIRTTTITVQSTRQSSSAIAAKETLTPKSNVTTPMSVSKALSPATLSRSTSEKKPSTSEPPQSTSTTRTSNRVPTPSAKSNPVSTVTSIFCNPDVGLVAGRCPQSLTSYYVTTWYGKHADSTNVVEPSNIPSKLRKDSEWAAPGLDGLGNDGIAEPGSVDTDEKRDAPIENSPQTLGSSGLNAVTSAPTAAAGQVLPAPHFPTTHHLDHTTRAGAEQQLFARKPQGITICAQRNCIDTSFPPFPGAATATIPEMEQGPLSNGAPYVPSSPAERVYRGVRWCLPWLGCMTFEMAFGMVMAGMWTLVMFWEW